MRVSLLDAQRFVRESNQIEGISGVRAIEIQVHRDFWALDDPRAADVINLVRVVAGAPLRDQIGMDVIVGDHMPPRGGPEMREALESLIRQIRYSGSPFESHVAYETLHPFIDGNGRSGRAIWAWQMLRAGQDPFSLPFLHRAYYQALSGHRSHYV